MARTKTSHRETDRTYSAHPIVIKVDQILTYLRDLEIPQVSYRRDKSKIVVIKNFQPLFTIMAGSKKGKDGYYENYRNLGPVLYIENLKNKGLIVEAIEEKLEYSKKLTAEVTQRRASAEKEELYKKADIRRRDLMEKILTQGGIEAKLGNIEYIKWGELIIFPTSTRVLSKQYLKIYLTTQEAKDDQQWAVKDLIIALSLPVYRITHESKLNILMEALKGKA